MEEKHHSVVGTVIKVTLLVVLVVIVVYGCVLGWEIWKLYQDAGELKDDFEALIARVEAVDFDDADEDIDEIALAVDDIAARLETPVFTVATILPVIGPDIEIARDLVAIVDDLVDTGVVPLADRVTQLTDEFESMSIGDLFNTYITGGGWQDLLEEFLSYLETLAELIDRTDAELNAMPAANFEELQEFIDYARELVDSLKPYADAYESIAGLVG